MKAFFVRRWFLILLALVLAAGFAFHQSLPRFGATLENSIVATVLFLTALPLDARAMWRALRHPTAALLAVAVNFGLLPLVAWGMSRALPPQMALGLMIAAAVPCTLASATVWTRRAGGNDAVAILVTMLTNLACFVVTPFWLWLTIGPGVQTVAIDPAAMALKLSLLVVVPILVAAQALRLWRPLGAAATNHKVALGVLSQFGILAMILNAAVQAGSHLAGMTHQQPTPVDWTVLVLCTVVLHVSMLAAGYLLGQFLALSRPDCIAVAISGSQKTMMVGLVVATGQAGAPLALLPLVVYHIGQLLIDTLLADWWRGHKRQPSEDESPAAAIEV